MDFLIFLCWMGQILRVAILALFIRWNVKLSMLQSWYYPAPVEVSDDRIAPIVRGQARAIEVKEDAEDADVEYITSKQSEMVWHKDVGGCGSWVSYMFLIWTAALIISVL